MVSATVLAKNKLLRTRSFLNLNILARILFLKIRYLSYLSCVKIATFTTKNRSSLSEVLLRKDVLKICSKFTGEHPSQSETSIKLLCNFIEIALRHGCSPLNLLHIFRTPFYKKTSGGLLLNKR